MDAEPSVAPGTRYAPAVDITEVILADHEEQRRIFARMDDVDRSDATTLGALWTRLSAMLEVHAKAEELFFYPRLIQLGAALHDDSEVAETEDAIGDHNDIRDGISEALKHPVGSDGWWSGVMAAREANDEHMGEEEHEGLADFRRHVSLEERHTIAVSFVAWQAEHVDGVPLVDEDPKEYVRENS